MSGIQEILLIVLLIVALIALPRLIPSKRQSAAAKPMIAGRPRITAKMRLALLASLVWLVAIAAVFAPWSGQWFGFLYAGPVPLVFAWGLYWVLKGFRKSR